MGFEVSVVVTLSKAPKEAVMSALDHQFEAVSHRPGTRTVELTEHVSIASEDDAIEFVRALVTDAIPEGSTITAITSTPD